MKAADLMLLVQVRESCQSGAARAARENARLTQREIGAACGVSARAVAFWESGRRTPTGPPALEYGKLLAKLARRAA